MEIQSFCKIWEIQIFGTHAKKRWTHATHATHTTHATHATHKTCDTRHFVHPMETNPRSTNDTYPGILILIQRNSKYFFFFYTRTSTVEWCNYCAFRGRILIFCMKNVFIIIKKLSLRSTLKIHFCVFYRTDNIPIGEKKTFVKSVIFIYR